MIELFVVDSSNLLYSQQLIRLDVPQFTTDIWVTLFPVNTPSRWTRSLSAMPCRNHATIYVLSYRNDHNLIRPPPNHEMGPSVPQDVEEKIIEAFHCYRDHLFATGLNAMLGTVAVAASLKTSKQYYLKTQCLNSVQPGLSSLIKFGQCLVGRVINNTVDWNGGGKMSVHNEPPYTGPTIVHARVDTNTVTFASGGLVSVNSKKYLWVRMDCNGFKTDLKLRTYMIKTGVTALSELVAGLAAVYVCHKFVSSKNNWLVNRNDVKFEVFSYQFHQLLGVSATSHGQKLQSLGTYISSIQNDRNNMETRFMSLFTLLFNNIGVFANSKIILGQVDSSFHTSVVDFLNEPINPNNSCLHNWLVETKDGEGVDDDAAYLKVYFANFLFSTVNSSKKRLACFEDSCGFVLACVRRQQGNYSPIINYATTAYENVKETYIETSVREEEAELVTANQAREELFNRELAANTHDFKTVVFATDNETNQEIKHCCCKGSTSKACGDAATLCFDDAKISDENTVKKNYKSCSLKVHPDKNTSRKANAEYWFKNLSNANTRIKDKFADDIIPNWSKSH